jgi:hypothetical protein
VYSSLSIILQHDSQDKSPAGQYLQLKTGGNLIYTVRNWVGGKLPGVLELLHRTGCFCCRWKFVPFPDGSWEKGVSVDILPVDGIQKVF